MTPSFPTRRSSDLTKTVKSSISESVRVRDNATTTSHRLTHRIALAGSMVMVVTMIHHAYGAWAYDAPWRRHVVPIAAALIAAMMVLRSEEHTSELQSLMRTSYAVFCLKKKKDTKVTTN